NLIGPGANIVARRDERAGASLENSLDVRLLRRFVRMQSIMFGNGPRLASEFVVARRAPYIGSDAVELFQDLLSPNDLVEDGATAEELWPHLHLRALLERPVEQVNAFEHAFFDSAVLVGGHRRVAILFVVDAQVVEDVLAFSVHASQASLHNHRQDRKSVV